MLLNFGSVQNYKFFNIGQILRLIFLLKVLFFENMPLKIGFEFYFIHLFKRMRLFLMLLYVYVVSISYIP